MNFDKALIRTNDNQDYLVIEAVENAGKTYLYLVNNNDESDSMFVEATEESIKSIDPDLFNEVIFPLFAKKLLGNIE